MEQKDQKKQPFFAKFLESQKKQEEAQRILEGLTWKIFDHYETHKYPSDNDEVGETE